MKTETRLNEINKLRDAARQRREHLRPACRIADIVRQAQKTGKKQVVFTLTKESMTVKEVA